MLIFLTDYFTQGTYRDRRARIYIAMQRRIELGPRLQEMKDFTEFLSELHKPPELLDLYFRWCLERPDDWPESNPPWPPGGLLFVMTEFWSSMRSDRNPRNKHHVLTAWSNTPNEVTYLCSCLQLGVVV